MSVRRIIRFTPVTWNSEDVPDEDVQEGGDSRKDGRHIITVFGKTFEGKSVCVHIPFRPCFYIEIGLSIQRPELDKLIRSLKAGMWELGSEFVEYSCTRGRSFVGYSLPDSSGFCRLTFRSMEAMKKAVTWFRYKCPSMKLYETNVAPIVRFLNDTNLQPCGVLEAAAVLKEDDEEKTSTCDLEAQLPSDSCLREVPLSSSSSSDNGVDKGSSASSEGSSSPPCTTRSPPIVIASFDIECIAPSGGFPDPSRPEDVIITICTSFSRSGESTPYRRVAVALGEVRKPSLVPSSSPVDAKKKDDDTHIDLLCCCDEAEVISTWARTLAEEKTDVLTGYNIWGFDMRYIHRRVLINGGVMNPKLSDFARHLGRVHRPYLTAEQTNVKSCGPMTTEATLVDAPGLLQVDVLFYVRRYLPLDNHKLSRVCEAFLGASPEDGKTDMTIRRMNEVWRDGTPEQKWEVLLYCTRDAELVTRLVQRLSILHSVFEMANVCGVPPNAILLQGEQIKVYSLILRCTRPRRMFCPTAPYQAWSITSKRPTKTKTNKNKTSSAKRGAREEATASDDQTRKPYMPPPHECTAFCVNSPPTLTQNPPQAEQQADGGGGLKGATVLEPLREAYWEPVVCLDFQSLYPSIMMAHNLCHSTMRSDDPPGEGRAAQRPKGVLPDLLADLRAKRNEAKAHMARAEAQGDAYGRALFDAKQLAYKVSMNSVYGFCGTETGILPCPRVASQITAHGRAMIERTKKYIEEEMSVDPPCAIGQPSITAIVNASPPEAAQKQTEENTTGAGTSRPRVVYGDTDSVMVLFPSAAGDPAACAELGARAAREVTALFPPPIKLCYEKCYMPYLLFSKKRYVGLILPEPAGSEREQRGKVDCKGMQFVRKDACAFVKKTCQVAMDDLLHRRDVQAAARNVRDAVRDLLEGRVPTEDLVVRKTIKASARRIVADEDRDCLSCRAGPGCCDLQQRPGQEDLLTCRACGAVRAVAYKSTQTPSLKVACEMERSPDMTGPKAGEEVPFLYTLPIHPASPSCTDRAMHPDMAARKGMLPDPLFYFEHQLQNVVEEVFRLVLPKDIKCVVRHLFRDMIRQNDARVSKQPRMSSFFLPVSSP